MRLLLLALMAAAVPPHVHGESHLLGITGYKSQLDKLTREAEEWPTGENTIDVTAILARDIAVAFQLTGKRAYAVKVRRILASQHGTPPPESMTWLAMAYDLVRDTMPEPERRQFEGEVLKPLSPDGPWEIAALLAVGFVEGDEQMKSQAIAAYRSELRDNVRADGTWREGGWRGHFEAMEPLHLTREMAEQLGVTIPEATALKRMADAANKVRFPDGSLPGFREKTARVKAQPWRTSGRTSELLQNAGVAMLRVSGSDHTVAVRLDRAEVEVYSNGEHLAAGSLKVDGAQPARTSGRVIEWCPSQDSTLIRFDAGPAYPGVAIERTVVLTARYLLDVVEARATDFGTHLWEWTGSSEYLRGSPKRDGRSVRFVSVYVFASDPPTVTEFLEEGPDAYVVAMGKNRDVISTAPGKFRITTAPYWEVRSTLH